ncbi:MAG: Short-chain dehydrogenase [Microbacteriaceae bacterium]|jgi:rhamnose utilization protein RhaD (predicted bifunctional aldolase and dehydrogenase)/NAD(P)-dependent dehydrogenase (short-subunit alcohol dehydrogenase family)|nr:Short-chain dehydrogenase [Microbacteriaceae bacterium]
MTSAHRALDDIVAFSRKLGERSDLVLHGGGNTSIKATVTDVFGDAADVIYVKGSGWDLATIEAAGFVPLRSDRLAKLLTLDSISDSEMMNELRLASLDSTAPDASVEALLHSFLPATAVLHSHADAIVTLSNLVDGERRVRELYGDRLVVVPYVMPGFDLAKAASELWKAESTPESLGMVLLNHGLFTVGDTAAEAYERHIGLVTEAEHYAASVSGAAPAAAPVDLAVSSLETALTVAGLRTEVSAAAGMPMILRRTTGVDVAAFVGRDDLASIAAQGPLTPEHSIRTKRVPQLGRDVAGYTAAYNSYVAHNTGDRAITPLTPEPRVILDSELGLLTAGRTAKDAAIAADIYRHTIGVIGTATRISEYRALSPADIFDVEYWELEQAKLARESTPLPFRGEVVIVTGAASGIGRACAEAFLAAGAAVIGLDRDPGVADTFSGAAWLGIEVDVTDVDAMRAAVYAGVDCFGGVDMLVMAAGIFAASAPIAELDLSSWRTSMAVNADAAVALLQIAHPFLKLAPDSGRVVLIATKNAAAPGPGAAAYSASKTAAVQLARVAALEWAEDGIRVNMVHPDAVFDTALWTPELIAARAAKYGMSESEYKTRNLLHAEVTSARVASMVQLMCTDVFDCTTGAQVPVDGGSDRIV